MRRIILLFVTIPCLGCLEPPKDSPEPQHERTKELGIIEEVRVTGVDRNINNKRGVCSVSSQDGLTSAVFVETRIVACAFIVRMRSGSRIEFMANRDQLEECTLRRSNELIEVGVVRWSQSGTITDIYYDIDGIWGEPLLSASLTDAKPADDVGPAS